MPEIDSLDSRVFGVSRRRLISSLAEQSEGGYLFESDEGQLGGYGLIRAGARAMYLGPVVAESPQVAVQLMEVLLRAGSGEAFYWDIPNQNLAATEVARALGFAPQRSLTRMYLGENIAPGEPLKQFAIAGPEVG